jgi:DnaJ-class molecular chaperone
MTDTHPIPRSEPPGDDGSGIAETEFVITYAEDERVPCPACSGKGYTRIRIFGQYETYACLGCGGRGDVTAYLAGLLERQGR